jgi:hypothetical protein
MSLPRHLVLGVTAAVAVGAAAGGAAAQEVQDVDVSATAEAGSRQFFVEDLSGVDLQTLDLGTSGQGQLFQVRVKDSGFLSPSAPFTASAEMTKLYRKNSDGTLTYTTNVDSSKIEIGYLGVPDVAGVAFGAVPTVQLAGALPTCDQLGTLLPLDSPLRGGTLLGSLTDPLNVLLSSMGLDEDAKPLCSALGGTSTTPLPVEQADAVLVQLQEELLQPALDAVSSLPVDVGESTEAGAFLEPSYLGTGTDDPGKTTTPATKRKTLGGKPNSAFDLIGHVSAVIDGQALFPAVEGGEGLTTVSSVVASLQASTDATVVAVGTALAGLSAADQTGVLSGLTNSTGPVATLVDAVLKRVSGTYRSFPQLKADLTGAAVGDYSGTLTVTFVQE